jgi:hypothetical protein
VLDRDLRISCVELPQNAFAIDSLITEANIFGQWVDANEPPMDEINDFTADDIARIWRVEPTSVELDATVLDWVAQLEEARALSKQASDLEAKAKDALAQMLLGNEIGLLNGKQVVSWKQQAGKSSLDTVRLKAEHPELINEYQKQGSPYRVMRTHKPKGETK